MDLLKGIIYFGESGYSFLTGDGFTMTRHTAVKHAENIAAGWFGFPLRNLHNVIKTAGYDIMWATTQNKRIADYWNLSWNTDMYYYTKKGVRTAKTQAYDMLLYAYLDKSSKGKEAYEFIRNHMISNGVEEKTIDAKLAERAAETPRGAKTIETNIEKAIDAVDDMPYYKNMTTKQKESYEDRATEYYRECLRKNTV